MDALDLEDLLADIARSGKGAKGAPKDVDLQLRLLQDSWAALNSWIITTMTGRKGVHIPSLCRMTWEFMDSDNSSAEVTMTSGYPW